jgi:hypothetical protein
MRGRWRALRRQLDEIADVDWRDPAWLAFAGGALALDAIGGRGDPHLYLGANGGPRSDNHMGRDAAAPADAADAVARAVARARAALDAIAALDGTLPEQPLRRALADRGGWLARVPASARAVAFATPAGCYLAELTPQTEDAVAAALGIVLAGRDREPVALARIDAGAAEPALAAVAVAVGTVSIHMAQHVHRLAWTRGGGPWLGIADAPPIAAVSTCHVVVDGYGHARVTDAVLAASTADRSRLLAAARLGLAGAEPPVPRLAPPRGAEALSFAARSLAHADGFAAQAYAYGRALARTFRAHWSEAERRAARRSPTFQVPIAPGAPDDPDRRKRRVVHALLALHADGGEIEPFARFRARLRPIVAREMAGEGILPRLAHGAAGAPLPLAWRRRLLRSRHRSHARMAPFEVLSGRGRFSSMRFPDGERPAAPLYAASSPTLLVTPEDPLGAVVLTLIHHDAGLTATAAGSGVAGTDDAVAAFLDTWCEELAIIRAHEQDEQARRAGPAAERVRGDRGGDDHRRAAARRDPGDRGE